MNQALAEHVNAVVLDNIPVALIGQGLHQLEAAHIAVLEDQANSTAGNDKLAYLDVGGASLIVSMGDWIASDSGGKADVLIIEQNDTPEQVAYISDDLLPGIREDLPGLQDRGHRDVDGPAAEPAHPSGNRSGPRSSIDYVASESTRTCGYVMEGLEELADRGQGEDAGALGDVSSLERVKSGQQAYDASPARGWGMGVHIDDVLRMLTGCRRCQGDDAPWRAFIAGDIGSVTVTAANVADDGIFGGDTYSEVFLKLWGESEPAEPEKRATAGRLAA